MSAPTHEPMVIIAAADILFASRTLTALVDGGSLLPMDRRLVQMAMEALARCEVFVGDSKAERPAAPANRHADLSTERKEV